MGEWNFKRENTVPDDIIPKGPIRVKIVSAEKTVSKANNDMLKIVLQASGYKQKLYHYITFMQDKPELTNRLLTQFFDSFPGIPEGEFNTANWTGAEGAAMITHDTYNGLVTSKVNWFIHRDRQTELPPYVDANVPERYAEEMKHAPNHMTENQPTPVQQQLSAPVQAPQMPNGSIPVMILPDGSIQLPDGRIIPNVMPVSQPQPVPENNFGPNQSWNNNQTQSFDDALNAFMGGMK